MFTAHVLPARFLSKVEFAIVGGCWLWTAAISDGYGLYWSERKLVSAHRFAYKHLVGDIADGLELDHVCENRRCVNPAHLAAVTHKVNLRRRFAGVTHCPQGHPYDLLNTIFKTRRDGSMNRKCRACESDYQFRVWLRKRQAVKTA